jgi:squalene-associated FAD-dependent desaturase
MAQARPRGEAFDPLSIHVIGAGLAGIAAACQLTESGRHVILHDSAKAPGGRARSYFDKALGCRIDNGNHLLLSGNTAAMVFLRRVGARHSLSGPAEPIFPFVDLESGKHWTLRLNEGNFPWWVFKKDRRVPGTRLLDYRALLKLRKAGPDDLVGAMLGGIGPLYRNLMEPLAIAVLNTMPEIAAAAPLRVVLSETIERGGFASVPRYARIGLSESFIDPAIEWLRYKGAEMRFGRRVAALDPNQPTVLAVPPWVAAELVPGLVVPDKFEAICNVHYRYALPPGEAGFWGLIGGMAEWVFARPEVLSVTISAANRYTGLDQVAIAGRVWAELAKAFGLAETVPHHRVIWEKRATFMSTPEQLARRPGTVTGNPNLVLAGDWTNTGLPATIEGAIRSGNEAASALLQTGRVVEEREDIDGSEAFFTNLGRKRKVK